MTLFPYTTLFRSGIFALSACHMSSSHWIVDTGASDHMISDKSLFSEPPISACLDIQLPNGSVVQSMFRGTVKLNDFLVLHNVLYVPSFSYNLLYVSNLAKTRNVEVHFISSKCVLQDVHTHQIIGCAELRHGLYRLLPTTDSVSNHVTTVNVAVNQTEPHVLWHARLGHVPFTKLVQVPGLHLTPCTETIVCDVCHFSKQKKLSYSSSDSCATAGFDLVHMDIWGPFAHASHCGFKYFLTVVDDYSRCTWVYMMQSKSEDRKSVV